MDSITLKNGIRKTSNKPGENPKMIFRYFAYL